MTNTPQKESKKSAFEIDNLRLLSTLQDNIDVIGESQRKHTWRSGSLWKEHLRSDLKTLIRLCQACLEIIK